MSLHSEAPPLSPAQRPDGSLLPAEGGVPGLVRRVGAWVARHAAPLSVVCWLLVAVSAALLVISGSSIFGWDLHVYQNATHSLALGHDPYADGTAVQRVFHASGKGDKLSADTPYTYVYSPMTLPLLRLAAYMPPVTGLVLYWMLYAAGVVGITWAGLNLTDSSERPFFLILASASPFFPGLLQNVVVLSGNLVYILYGSVLCAAVLGWRKNVWLPFYAAVFITSCFKAPLLTLVVIPLFSARRQWIGAGVTSALGLAAFVMQSLLYPRLFHSYLDAVELQFSFNHDFGFSPSGLLGEFLFGYHLPYYAASTAIYCLYGAAILGTLAYLARLYLGGAFPLERWAPVLLVGVILLNPRVKEYDVAPLTLPMCLVVWRLLLYRNTVGRALFEAALFGIAINSFASLGNWEPLEGVLLPGVFIAGAWHLLRGQAPALTPFLVQTSSRAVQ